MTIFRDPGTLAIINTVLHLIGSLNLELAMVAHSTCRKSKMEVYFVVSISHCQLINVTLCDSLGVKAQKQHKQVDVFDLGLGVFAVPVTFPSEIQTSRGRL